MNSSPKRSYFPPKKEAGNVPNVTEKLPGLMDMICKEADMRDDTRSQSQFLEDTNIIISKMLDANSVNSMLDNSEKLGRDQQWGIVLTCAKTGQGLDTGLEMLHMMIVKKKMLKKRIRNKTK